MTKPKRLQAGDTVALISPSSGIEPERIDAAIANMADLGLKVKLGRSARKLNGFLAGTDAERLADLHEAFADKEVNGIWCIRGGYGATRYLPLIDFRLIKKNPKVFIGYSDITALLVSIHQRTGLVTFHGPAAASTFSGYTRTNVVNVLMTPQVPHKIEVSPDNTANETSVYKTKTVTKGTARGKLIGGNLSLIAAMSGTPYALEKTKGSILFIEDVGEAPYRIDRMLTQLRQAVDLRKCAGIACGIFSGCERKDDLSQSLIDVIKDRLGDIGIPVVYGLSFGHIRDQFTMPLGVKAKLDADNATLTLLESGVS
jgi:muramoyltetrapeptide carboxypeptidase